MKFSRRKLIGASSVTLLVESILSRNANATSRIAERVELSQLEYKLRPEASKKVRIGFISDIHLTGDPLQEAPFLESLALLQAASPELLILGGDYVLILDQIISKAAYSLACNRDWFAEDVGYNKNREHVRKLFTTVAARVRETFGASLPVVAMLGNHDNWHGPDLCAAEFEKANISLLVNQAKQIGLSSGRVSLFAVDDFGTGTTRLDSALSGDIKIFLTHNPDIFSLGSDLELIREYDLSLAGHSHGGQIVLPLIGAPFSNLYDTCHLAGWSKGGGRDLYVSRGVGTSGVPVRYNCPPEAVLLDIYY